jgi:hypothetical protein
MFYCLSAIVYSRESKTPRLKRIVATACISYRRELQMYELCAGTLSFRLLWIVNTPHMFNTGSHYSHHRL